MIFSGINLSDGCWEEMLVLCSAFCFRAHSGSDASNPYPYCLSSVHISFSARMDSKIPGLDPAGKYPLFTWGATLC